MTRRVLVTGGMVRPLQHSLVNPFGALMLEQISAHIAFIGCNGVDAERGVTNLNFAEAEVKRAMIHAAREVVVVADERSQTGAAVRALDAAGRAGLRARLLTRSER